MEANPFILALSKTLPESCMQALVVYLVLQLLFLGYKKSMPFLKFNLYYAANLCLFFGFLYTFFHHYQQVPVVSFNHHLLLNEAKSGFQTIIAKPGLWLQFNFWTSRYAYLITGLYLLGLLFCMLKLTIGIINISWFRNNKQLKLDDYLTNISIQLSTHFRFIKTVPVYLSDQIFVPLTIGFIKPMIVFPIALINQLSPEQTEAILLHELAHIKRNDYLLNIVLCIIQSFLFFNPAIWLMGREINKYREQCCDDLVLDNTQHELAYARALLLIEESRSTQLILALTSNGKKYNLLNRIKRITNMKINDPSPQNKLVVLLLAVIVIGLTVAWNMPVKKALQHLPAYLLTNFKTTKTKSDSSKFESMADTISIIRYSATNQNQKNNKLSFSGKQLVYNPIADTVIKSKNKFKIILEDSLGNKKEYNSLEELPADAQKEFLKENGKFDNKFNDVTFSYNHPDSTAYSYHSKFYNLQNLKRQADEIKKMEDKRENSPEFKKRMEELRAKRKDYLEKAWLQLYSPEFKKQAEEIRKQEELIKKQVNSPEFKKQMEEFRVKRKALLEKAQLQLNSPEFKKQMDEMLKQSKAIAEQAHKQFDSPEFKLKMEKLQEESKAIGEQAHEDFDSPEFKKQMEILRLQAQEMGKYYQSPGWKKQQKKMKKEIEKSQKEWKKSMDIQPLPAMLEKLNQPDDL